MATYIVTSPEGEKFKVNAPDGAPEDAVMRYAQTMFKRTPDKPKIANWKPSDPTEGMSLFDTVAAGAGKRLADVGRSIGQMTGAVSEEDAAQARKLDAPLMDTGGGMAGSILTDLATAVIPGTQSIKGAAMLSGALGALRPTVQGESRMQNIATDAALGGGVTAGLKYVTQAAQSALAARQAKAASEAALRAPADAAIAAGREAGYVAPPSITGGGAILRGLEGLSGKQKTNQAMAIKNQPVTEKLARRYVGLPEDAPVTPEVLQGIRNKAFEEGYGPVSRAGVVKTDSAYKAALDKIEEKYTGAAADFPGVVDDSVRGFINGTKSKTIPAKTQWVDESGRVVSDFQEQSAPKLRNLLDEIKKNGGISVGEVAELNTATIHKNYPGLLRKNGGNSADGLLEWMKSTGWIDDATAAAAENMPGGAQEIAKDMVRSALARERVIHPAQYDKWAAYAQFSDEATKAGINKVTIPAQEVSGLRVPEFDAANGIKVIQALRDDASKAYAQGDKALGKAKREAAKVVEDQIERHLASFGDGAGAKEMLENFRNARQLMAKTHSLERALVPGTNQIDARQFARMLAKGKKLSGEAKTIADFSQATKGSGLTSSITGVPEPGWATSLSPLDYFTAGIGTQAPAMLALPLARVAARQAILSGPAQRMARPNYGPGAFSSNVPKALSKAEKWRLGLLAPAFYGAQE